MGLDEQTVSIGEILGVGSAEMQVNQPRQPCFKLALRFADKTLGRIMMQSGRTGWYMRVLKTGELQAGDAIRIVSRPNPRWTIARFNEFLRHRSASVEDMTEHLQAEGLAEEWREGFRETLKDRQ